MTANIITPGAAGEESRIYTTQRAKIFTTQGLIMFCFFIFFVLILVYSGYLLNYTNSITHSYYNAQQKTGKGCGIPPGQLEGLNGVAIALIVLSCFVILFTVDTQFPMFFHNLIFSGNGINYTTLAVLCISIGALMIFVEVEIGGLSGTTAEQECDVDDWDRKSLAIAGIILLCVLAAIVFWIFWKDYRKKKVENLNDPAERRVAVPIAAPPAVAVRNSSTSGGRYAEGSGC